MRNVVWRARERDGNAWKRKRGRDLKKEKTLKTRKRDQTEWCLAMWSGLERQVTIYWVTHVVNLEQQNSDEETKSWLPNLKEVAADPKQRSHGMSGRIVQQIHVRSLFSLLVGTAVRDGSLYSAYSRTQTGRFEFSAWYPKRERRQQLKQSKRHYNGDWSNAHMGSTND